MNIYQSNILDRYNYPQYQSRPDHFTHSKRLENLSCGDQVEVYLMIEGEQVRAIHYQGEGCVIALASAEILAEKLRGQTRRQITKLTWQDAVDYLGITLTGSRIKCAHLALEAIQQAIDSPV